MTTVPETPEHIRRNFDEWEATTRRRAASLRDLGLRNAARVLDEIADDRLAVLSEITDCKFCAFVIGSAEVIATEGRAVAFRDGYPSALGHTLVVPTRHVARLRDLEPDEMADMWTLVRGQIDRLGACCYTVGFNDGVHAGQTVPHVHMHIIPRVEGDVPDPTFGIRWVIPETAEYRSTS